MTVKFYSTVVDTGGGLKDPATIEAEVTHFLNAGYTIGAATPTWIIFVHP